jgi:hypothetical protein
MREVAEELALVTVPVLVELIVVSGFIYMLAVWIDGVAPAVTG